MALTQHPVWSAGCCGDPEAGVAPPQAGAAFQGYIGRSSAELVENLRSPDSVTAAVALAAVNALVNRADVSLLPGDLLDYLAVRPEDIVGMVGFFGPLVRPLRSRCRHLHIFERRDEGDCLPADEAYELLPKCDIAIITSGTITNGSIDGLLAACASCREVAMVGASTPCSRLPSPTPRSRGSRDRWWPMLPIPSRSWLRAGGAKNSIATSPRATSEPPDPASTDACTGLWVRCGTILA